MFAFSTAPSSAARTQRQALQRHLLRSGLMAAACCAALVGTARAEDSTAIFSDTPTHYNATTITNTQVDVLALAPAASAMPQANAGLQTNAVAGQVADVGSTGIGLIMGAAEANPLGIVTLGLKAVVYKKIKDSPPVEQPRLWGMYGALGWGAAANNLCVIAAIATGGAAAAVCPLIGLGAGMGSWSAGAEERDKATFAVMCQEAKVKNPDLVCIFNGANS